MVRNLNRKVYKINKIDNYPMLDREVQFYLQILHFLRYPVKRSILFVYIAHMVTTIAKN